MSKMPSPFGKPKKIGTPTPAKATPAEGDAQMKAGMQLQKFLAAGPGAPKKQPAPTPVGGFKPGLSGEQYGGGDGPDKYAGMKGKLTTKDKVLNPLRGAVGLPKAAKKMVPVKPPKK